ncbi:MAG TPA: RNA-binding transcriptional accessory protein, partial [Glaciecola sp.]|nr:RNA-binding transcriptional accessory protein [Glaciecola sp.]
MIIRTLANELAVKESQVQAAVALLDEGATVPFIARYRKEVTNGLDDTQLRNLESRLGYLRDLHDRKTVILKSINDQGKLTDALSNAINNAASKTLLEDLYLPYKPRRRTKGQIAIEAGLEPLANALYQDPTLDPQATATQYINVDAGFNDEKAVLEGAKFILMEQFAEDAQLLQKIRQQMTQHGYLVSQLNKGKEREASKFTDYFTHQEKFKNIPSHRALAMFRGRNEGFLALNITLDP